MQQQQDHHRNVSLLLETLDALEHARLSSENEREPDNKIFGYCCRQVILIMKLVNKFSDTSRNNSSNHMNSSSGGNGILGYTNDDNNDDSVNTAPIPSWIVKSSPIDSHIPNFSSSISSHSYSRSTFFRHLPSFIRCIRKINDLAFRVATREENYFCTYNFDIYNSELRSVATYVKKLLVLCRNTDHHSDDNNSAADVDPILLTYEKGTPGISSQEEDQTTPPSCQHFPNELLSTTAGDVISKLFWLKYFRDKRQVDWDTYVDNFVIEYGSHHQYSLGTYRNKLARGADSSTPTVHIEDYIIFGTSNKIARHDRGIIMSNSCVVSVYQAFQQECDPGSLVLITGQQDDKSERTPLAKILWVPTVIDSLLGHKICQISCGGQHAAVLGADGSLYTWGHGGFGRLGHGDQSYCVSPRRVSTLKEVKIKQVSCGFAYSAAVSVEGVVYTWGAGDNGRLGLGDKYDRNTPVIVEHLLDEKTSSVHAGSVHTVFLSNRGAIFACGKWEYSGVGSDSDVYVPTPLKALEGIEIKQVSLGPGGYHSIAVSSKNEVYAWGHNRVGQLGIKNDSSISKDSTGAYYINIPTRVKDLFPPGQEGAISQVVAGWGHSGVLTESGTAYICGRNARGQLGLGDITNFEINERNHPYKPLFTPVDTMAEKKIVSIICGGEHSIFLCDHSEVYGAGTSNKGQLGLGEWSDKADLVSPVPIESLNKSGRSVQQVVTGSNCTMFLVGKFNPSPLSAKCNDVINNNPDLMIGNSQLGAMDISQENDYDFESSREIESMIVEDVFAVESVEESSVNSNDGVTE